ncbi:MAG: hypothetical protein QM765_34470 [Myxococcales bacterium]
MEQFFYDDPLEALRSAPAPSIFLAGPTSRGVRRTAWRAQALELLQRGGYPGSVILPEFRDGLFDERAPQRFGAGQSPVPSMRTVSFNVLTWETTGLEAASRVLFWMPFCVKDEEDPESLPGFTTRAEVARELQRSPGRLVLGMPPGALSSSHIRYHAHHSGLRIWETLEQTVAAALAATAKGPA